MSSQIDDLKKQSGLPAEAFAKVEDQIRVRTDQFRQIYANNMQVGFSSWDLAITFGQIMREEDGKAVIEELDRVLMTREIAKVLAIILTNHVAAFEAVHGEIKVPILVVEPKADEPTPSEAPAT